MSIKDKLYLDPNEYDDTDRMFNRRDFLLAAGLLLVSGKMVYDSFDKILTDSNEKKERQHRQNIKDMIYNEYPKYQHMSETKSKIEVGINESGEDETGGYGIIVEDKYITVAHVCDNSTRSLSSPYGTINVPQKVIEDHTSIYGVELEKIHKDLKNDFAVFQIPKEIEIKYRFGIDDICFDEPRLGDRVYIIGNPRCTGKNVRTAYISDLDSADKTKSGKPGNPLFVGFDKPIISCDSGTFTVNQHGKVVCINAEGISGVVGWGIKMKVYKKYLI